jgi:hypothetical protein
MISIDIARKIILAFGISILIGSCFGYFLANDKYYFLHPKKPKREITKVFFEKNKTESDLLKQERNYNLETAILTGLVSFGACLIVIALKKPKRITE